MESPYDVLERSVSQVPEALANEAAALGTVASFRCESGGSVEEVVLDFRTGGADTADDPTIVISLQEPAIEQLAREGRLDVDASWRNGWLTVAGSALDWSILGEVLSRGAMQPPSMREVLDWRARQYALVEEQLSAHGQHRLIDSFRSWCRKRPTPIIDHFVSDFGPLSDSPTAWFDPEAIDLTAAVMPLWSDIREEARQFASGQRRVPAYHREGDAESDFATAPLKWGKYTVYKEWRVLTDRLAGLPATAEFLRAVQSDRLVNLAFFALGPNSTIPVHTDGMPLFVGWHLGLVVPQGCTVEVAGSVRTHEEGKCLTFCDAFLHRAANLGVSNRLVLSAWYMHPELTDSECAALQSIAQRIGVDLLSSSV